MKGSGLGFTRRGIIRFAVVFFASLALLIFCVTRMVSKYYNYSENAHMKIKDYTDDLWHLQEVNLFAVNTQRSSLNLLIYSGNKAEMGSVQNSIDRNRDSLNNELFRLGKYKALQEDLCKRIQKAGSEYLAANTEFGLLATDSVKSGLAADFNSNKMRPALRKLTDLIRETGKAVTIEIQKTAEGRLNLFSMFEFWGLLLVAIPYLYFIYRFLHLFIKIVILD